MSEENEDEPWGYLYDHKGNCIGTVGPPVTSGPPEPVIVNPFRTEQPEPESRPMYLIDRVPSPETYGFRETYVCGAGLDDLISQMLDNEGDE